MTGSSLRRKLATQSIEETNIDNGSLAKVAVETVLNEAKRGVFETDNDNRGQMLHEDLEDRREGVHALKNTTVATCTFIRLA